MFIVFITRGYPSKNHPQIGNFEATQARALTKLGHKVIIIGVNCYSIRYYDILGSHHRVDGNIEVFENYNLAIPSHNRMPFEWKSKILSNKIQKRLNRIIKEYGRPDVIHSHYLLITTAISRVIKDYNIPLVCTEHWSKINSSVLPKSIIEAGKRGYMNVDKILAVSNQTSKSIYEKFGYKAEVVSNMVEDNFFETDLNKKVNDEFTFISIGSMNNDIKGFDILLKAFAEFINHGEKGKLYIVGYGVCFSQYVKLAEELGITSKVVFLKELNHSYVAKYIEESHVVVMSSRSETFGVVLIEGMAKGKPVIATRCGGPEDIITPEMGILVSVENVDELCNAMIEVKHNYETYNQDKIKSICYDNYSQNHVSKRLTFIYESVLKNRIDF